MRLADRQARLPLSAPLTPHHRGHTRLPAPPRIAADMDRDMGDPAAVWPAVSGAGKGVGQDWMDFPASLVKPPGPSYRRRPTRCRV
jgi:hypothetical protein